MKTWQLTVPAAASLASLVAAQTDCGGPRICTAICAPTCGSDGRTYSSPCTLKWASCENSTLVEVAPGVCPGDAVWNGTLCGSEPPVGSGSSSDAGSTGGSASGSADGSAGDNDSGGNATSTPKPETPTVTSPGSAPVPAPSSGAGVRSGLVASAAAVAVTVLALAL